MRETIVSLRVYFILVGLYLAVRSALELVGQPFGIRFMVAILAAAFALAYMYIGIRIKHVLVASPGLIIFVLVASAVISGIGLLIGSMTWNIAMILMNSGDLLIAWYLCANVWRLSAGLAAEPLPNDPGA